MELSTLIKGAEIGDLIVRLIAIWNADHPNVAMAKETYINAIKERIPQANLDVSDSRKLSNSVEEYLKANDPELYAATKIGVALELPETIGSQGTALLRVAVAATLSSVPDSILSDKDAAAEIIVSDCRKLIKIAEIFKLMPK